MLNQLPSSAMLCTQRKAMNSIKIGQGRAASYRIAMSCYVTFFSVESNPMMPCCSSSAMVLVASMMLS